jgi:hypothetical protein
VVWFRKCLVVLVDPEIKKIILGEAHKSKFSIHPGSTKMYQDLKWNFWWSNIKVDIQVCSRVRYLPPDESKPFLIGRCTPTPVDTHVEVG